MSENKNNCASRTGTPKALRMEITAALQELTPEELKLLAQLIQGMKERGGCEDE